MKKMHGSLCLLSGIFFFGAVSNSETSPSFDAWVEHKSENWSSLLYKRQGQDQLLCALEASPAGESVFRIVLYKTRDDAFIEIFGPTFIAVNPNSNIKLHYLSHGLNTIRGYEWEIDPDGTLILNFTADILSEILADLKGHDFLSISASGDAIMNLSLSLNGVNEAIEKFSACVLSTEQHLWTLEPND